MNFEAEVEETKTHENKNIYTYILRAVKLKSNKKKQRQQATYLIRRVV